MNPRIAERLRTIAGAVAIGWAAFLVVVVALTMIGSGETLESFMQSGGLYWAGLSALAYPISRHLFANRR